MTFLPAMVWVLSLFLSLMACTWWFQFIFTSFRQYVIPTGHFLQKSLSSNLKIGFLLSSSPNHAFSYLWPMTHHLLYWLGIGWWCLGLACAPLLCMSKTCPLLMRLSWSRGSSAHSTAPLWLLMSSAIFWFFILYGLLLLGVGLCLIAGSSSFSLLFYSFLQSCYHFLPYHSDIPAVMLFDPWPTTSCIGWVQAGDVWALRVLHFYVCPKLARCSCIYHGLEACLLILPPIFDFLWHELFSNSSFFMAYSF